ncbi:MAG: hypothetical protein ABI889_04010 [Gemmatimonadota bacterium]
MARYADSAQRRDLDDIIIVDPLTMLEDEGPNSRPAALRNDAPQENPAALLATPGGDPEAVALAMQLLGEHAPLAVTVDGMSFTIGGWELGSQRADSMDAEGLACWVSVDILLLENGRYLVREHRATEDTDGMIASESNGSIIETGAELRAYCTDHTPDPLRAASRVAALDNAMRRWPPLRSPSGRARSTPLVIPFLD